MEQFSTQHYIIEIDVDEQAEDRYLCRNKETGVVEFKDHLLPRVIDTLLHLEKNLTDSVAKYEADKAPVPKGLKLVPEDGNGSGNLH